MPQLLVSTGTSSESEIAYLNALAGVIGAMNEAGESRIVSRRVEETPNGIVVTVEVVVYSAEELLEMEPDEEAGDGEADALARKMEGSDQISDYAYLRSAEALQHEREILLEQSIEEMAHPEQHTPYLPHVENEFEDAAQASDASYVHAGHDNDNREGWGGRITTELAEQEIEDSVRHDVLSAGVVEWQDRQPPTPETPVLETPVETFQKDAKNRRPAPDDLDLVA